MAMSKELKAELADYSLNEQAEMEILARKIDITKIDDIKSYLEKPFNEIIETCNNFLFNMDICKVENDVINEMEEIAKESEEIYHNFNFYFQNLPKWKRFCYYIFNRKKIKHFEVECYKKLIRLRRLCDIRNEAIKNSININYFSEDVIKSCETLKKYILSWYMATDRIEFEFGRIKLKSDQSGTQEDLQQYECFRKNYVEFWKILSKLKETEHMFELMLELLEVIKQIKRNMLVSINVQKHNLMALIRKQFRIAELAGKGSDELTGNVINKVLSGCDLTSEEFELLIKIFGVDEAKEAIENVIFSCRQISNIKGRYELKIENGINEIKSCLLKIDEV